MEATKEDMSLLHKIAPPKLEDAGLEDCALPLHSIHEAFLKAASAIAGGSRAADDDDEPPHDELVGLTPEVGPPSGACTGVKGGTWGASGDLVSGERNEDDVLKKGDDVVVIGGGGGGEVGGCVDETRDLGIKGREHGDDDDDDNDNNDDKSKKPTLIEGFFCNP